MHAELENAHDRGCGNTNTALMSNTEYTVESHKITCFIVKQYIQKLACDNKYMYLFGMNTNKKETRFLYMYEILIMEKIMKPISFFFHKVQIEYPSTDYSVCGLPCMYSFHQ
jgi:hypothetical protein